MSYPEDLWRIDTPENVVFGYEIAGIGSRFLAAMVDTLLILVLQVIVILLTLLLARVLLESVVAESALTIWLVALAGLLAFAFLWGYYVFFELIWNGQSPGKRWVGLRVMRTDGTPITLVESLIRNLVRLIDFLPVYYGAGIVTMFVNQQARRLGDLAAGTMVVHDRATVTLEGLATKPAIPELADPRWALAIDLPIERLNSLDIQMAEEFLHRRAELYNRTAVAARIADALLKRMDVPISQVAGVTAEDLITLVIHTGRQESA